MVKSGFGEIESKTSKVGLGSEFKLFYVMSSLIPSLSPIGLDLSQILIYAKPSIFLSPGLCITYS